MNFSIETLFYIIGLVVWLGATFIWVGKTNTNIKHLQDGLKEVKDDLKSGLASVQEDIRTVQEDIRTVQEDIKKLFERLPLQKTADASSPLKLTDFGQKISDHVNAKKWAVENVENLINEAKDKEEFEIFNMCFDHVKHCFDENEEFNRKIQSIAYEYGTEIEEILKVYQVELRDQILVILNPPTPP